MAFLPDEVWTEILQAGVGRGVLDYRDLCCLALASRVLHRLASLASLWKLLFLRDFPHDSSNLSSASLDYKASYGARFGKIKAAKVAAHRRQLLRLQSEAVVLENESKDLEKHIQEERLKLSGIIAELRRLEQARRSSIALRLWQPGIVQSMHHQFVEQQPVDPEFRQRSLEMEAKLCKEEMKRCIAGIDRKRHALERVKKDLEYLTYNPLHVFTEPSPSKRPKQASKADKHLPKKLL